MNCLLILILSVSVTKANETLNKYLKFNTEVRDEFYTKNVEISNCVARIVDQYFDRKHSVPLVVAIKNKTKSLNEESYFLIDLVNVVVKEIGTTPAAIAIIHKVLIKSPLRNGNFIIIIDDSESFQGMLSLLPVLKYAYEGRIMFVYIPNSQNNYNTTIDNIQVLFEQCWKHNMVNVVVVAHIGGFPRIFSYFPYLPETCSKPYMVELDVWINNNFLNKNVQFFPLKAANLNGCMLNVAVIMRKPHVIIEKDENETKIHGVEVNLVNLLSQLMRFNFTLYEPVDDKRWGYWNSTHWIGALGDIIYGRAQMAIGAYIPGLEEYNYVDFTYGYDSADVVWTLPKFERDSPWVKMFLPFKMIIWIIILFTILGLIILFHILKCVVHNRSVHVENIVLDIWQISLGMPLEIMPVGRFVCYSYLLWIWMSMVIRNIYQGSLVGHLTGTVYEEKLKTMQDILDEDLEVYGSHAMADLLVNVNETVVQKIYKKMHVIDINQYGMIAKKIAVDNYPATLLHVKPQVLQLNKLYEKQGMLRILREIYRSQIISMVLSKFSPLSLKTKDLILTLTEVGFIDKWLEDYQATMTPKDDELIILQLKHIYGPYLILLFGLGLSLLVFVKELVYFKHFTPKPQKQFIFKKGHTKTDWRVK